MPATPKPAKGSHKKSKHSYRSACVKQREKVRAEVMLRCKGRCEMTGREGVLELHECHPRSLTRNMAPDLRFNSKWCLLLTHEAHQSITDGFIWTFFGDRSVGANGLKVYIEAKTQDEALTMALATRRSADWYTPRQVWEHYRQNRP